MYRCILLQFLLYNVEYYLILECYTSILIGYHANIMYIVVYNLYDIIHNLLLLLLI